MLLALVVGVGVGLFAGYLLNRVPRKEVKILVRLLPTSFFVACIGIAIYYPPSVKNSCYNILFSLE
jgi:hypothetical protein